MARHIPHSPLATSSPRQLHCVVDRPRVSPTLSMIPRAESTIPTCLEPTALPLLTTASDSPPRRGSPPPHSFFLLASPSFSIPSQPTALPANASMPPNPCLVGSRCSPAAFMAATPCA